MFDFIRRFFKHQTQKTSEHYVVLARGVQVYETTTLEDAESFIRETFERVDAKRKVGRGWGSNCGVGKRSRWNGYKSQCKIVKKFP
jgi:hypothetical protein